MFNIQLRARDIMSSPVITVRDNLSIKDVTATFKSKKITGAPVINEYGTPVGVISYDDIVRHEPKHTTVAENISSEFILSGSGTRETSGKKERDPGTKKVEYVRDIMTPFIYRVDESTSVGKLVDVMLEGNIHRIFVSRGDDIVGVITALDILKIVTRIENGYTSHSPFHYSALSELT
jgi:predicted transcriptional regulator